MTDLPISAALDRQRRAAGIGLEACWLAYFQMGGQETIGVLGAFLDGAATLRQSEVDVLAAAIFDLTPTHETGSRPSSTLLDLIDVGPLSTTSAQILGRLAEELNRIEELDGGSRSLLGSLQLTETELTIRSDSTTTIRALPVFSPAGDSPIPDRSTGSRLRVDSDLGGQWEMHANGEELLVLLSGEAQINVDRSDSTITVLQRPYEAFVIPRGHWHRHRATQVDTKVLFLTPSDPG